MKRRRRAWIWISAAVATVMAVAALIVWDVHRRADAVIERHRQEAKDLLDAFLARSSARPPFDGKGIDGNAWDDFRGVAQLGNLPGEQETLEFESNSMPPDDEALGVLFLRFEPELVKLRQGLNRKDVDPGIIGSMGVSESLSLIRSAMATGKTLGIGIGHYHRMRRDGKALELAELGLGFSQDAGRRIGMGGLSLRNVLERIVAAYLQSVLVSHGLGAVELETFARRLDALDAVRPTPELDWAGEEISSRIYLSAARWTAEDVARASNLIGFRQLWSIKLARVGALELLPAFFHDGRGLMKLPLHERFDEAERLHASWGRERNLIHLDPSLMLVFKGESDGLRVRTLLRVAVALACREAETGSFPASLNDLVPRHIGRIPLDPLSGKALGYTAGKVWVPGPDGIDHGGAADPVSPWEPRDGFDLVWTVKRRK